MKINKLNESMTIAYSEDTIKRMISQLEKEIEDYKQLIIDEPEDKAYWEEEIKKCEEEIADLQSYKPLDESASWQGPYDEFESIIDKFGPFDVENIEGAVKDLYMTHKGEPDWDEAYRRWNEGVIDNSKPSKSLFIIKDAQGNQLSAPNANDEELWDRVSSMEARGRKGLQVVVYTENLNTKHIKSLGESQSRFKVFGAKVNKLNEASYGGAYDIEDDQYFTRDDLNEAAESVVEFVCNKLGNEFELGGTWFEKGQWIVNVQDHSFGEYEVAIPIDMRKIKNPKSLSKSYATICAKKLIDQIKEYNMEESFNKNSKNLKEEKELLSIKELNPDGTPKQYDVKFMELEKVPGLLNWDVADQLQKHFRDNKLWVDELHYNEVKDCIEYDINWGDWTHEHLRSKWLLEELFKELGIVAHINSYTTEEDGSDTYSAHYTIRATGKMNEAITPPTGNDSDLSAIP